MVDKETQNLNIAGQTTTNKYVKEKVGKVETQNLKISTTPETVVNAIELDKEGDLRRWKRLPNRNQFQF